MKIAILSDIHGNYYALMEVVKELNNLQISKVLCLGDYVGYYYQANEVLEKLDQFDCVLIKGNHEEMLLDLISGNISEDIVKKKYGYGLLAAKQELSKDQISFLRDLPNSIEIEIDSIKFSLNHGKLTEDNRYGYLYPTSSRTDLESCSLPGIDFVLFGHSHYQFLYRGGVSTIINPGSVGQSRMRGGFANWCIINTENGVVQLRNTPYDVRNLIKDIDQIGDEPEYLKQVLVRNNY